MERAGDQDAAIERHLRIDARPGAVFDCWVDADRLVTWMGRAAELDPRPGGVFRLDYNGSDIVRGEFLEVDRPRGLVLTWGWEAAGDPTPPGASRVELRFEPDGDGTAMTLRHSGLAPEAIDGHAEGWDTFLARLPEAVT